MASFEDRCSDGKAWARLTRRGFVFRTFGLVAGAVATAGLEAVPAAAQPQGVTSASRFVLQANGKTVARFTQLKGISEPNEYIYSNPNGSINRTKQFGKSKPPEVVLEGPGENQTVWNWHEQALAGKPNAKKTMTLLIENASHQVVASYTLDNAWVSKIELSGLKAGSSSTVMETVTIVCDQIILI